jgi:hypothetical protein
MLYKKSMEDIDSKLKEFLDNGKDWERKQTNIPSVFLLRLPSFRSRPECIAIEIDAINGGAGGSNRRRGIIIRSQEEILELSRILENPKLNSLASAVEKINPPQAKSSTSTVDSEIFEI